MPFRTLAASIRPQYSAAGGIIGALEYEPTIRRGRATVSPSNDHRDRMGAGRAENGHRRRREVVRRSRGRPHFASAAWTRRRSHFIRAGCRRKAHSPEVPQPHGAPEVTDMADHQGDRTSRRWRICCTGAPAPVRSGCSGRSTWTCCRPVTRAARLARISRRGWRTPRRAIMSRRGGSWSPTIRCRRSTGGCAITRARASATGPASTAPSRFTRSSGSSATWRWSGGGHSIRRRSAAVSGCSSSAPGRAGFRPPTTWPGSVTRSRSGTRASGRAG